MVENEVLGNKMEYGEWKTGVWSKGHRHMGMRPTSLSLYQVRLSELRTNQYSLVEPLMRETGMLSQPLRMSWWLAVRVPPCLVLEALSKPMKSGWLVFM